MKVPNKWLLIALLIPHFLFAQSTPDTVHTSINKKRLHAFVLSSSMTYTTAIVGLSKLWYSDSDQQDFKFFNDYDEWKQMDKLGHFYSAFHITHASSKALQWSNINKRKSDLIGSATAILILAPIEVLDGFSNAYGASTGDLLANAGGTIFYLAQSKLWNEVRIWPKFSYHQTRYAPLNANLLGNSVSSEILKDYNGQTHWISFDMDKFLKFPKWLNLAIGYGGQDMVYARDQQNLINGYDPYRQYYLSVDFDLNAVKTKSKVIRTLIFFVNMIKLPAPAMEFSRKGARFHTIYF